MGDAAKLRVVDAEKSLPLAAAALLAAVAATLACEESEGFLTIVEDVVLTLVALVAATGSNTPVVTARPIKN